jgi:hypothetical protein
MGFFGKKEQRAIPDLPSPREAGFSFKNDEDDEMGGESHVLPAFPDSPSHNKFSEAMIKDAVSMQPVRGNDDGGLAEVPRDEKQIRVVEMEEWQPSSKPREEPEEPEEFHAKFMPPKENRIPHLETKSVPTENRMRMSVPEPVRFQPRKEATSKEIFVRIDKYHTARKALSEIAERLEEIDENVRKIREVKLREEQELATWERDIMNAKLRIKDVSDNLFDNTE